MKKVFLKILKNSHKNICARITFLTNFKNETHAQAFSCEF